MKKHIIVSSIVGTLLSFNVLAQDQSCPTLKGVFTCAEPRQAPYRLEITEVPFGNQTSYDFNSSADGFHRFIPNGLPQEMHSSSGKGTYSTVCENGWLVTTFLLTKADGTAYHVQDKMHMERKAIVSIRLSLPSSQVRVKDVFVCRPYFPPRGQR